MTKFTILGPNNRWMADVMIDIPSPYLDISQVKGICTAIEKRYGQLSYILLSPNTAKQESPK